jgi:modulator of FtsH protease HflK
MKTTLRTILLVVPVAVALLVGATGWVMVAPGEVVLVRRLGRLIEPAWGPGLHWRFPAFIDRIDRLRADAVRQLTFGTAGTAGLDDEPSSGEVMTGDLNLLKVQATVQYRVSKPRDYAFRVDAVDPLLSKAAAATIARAVSRRGVDAVLRTERQAVARETEHDLATLVDHYRLGVTILGVSLTDARPPSEVAAEFAAAQSAESERDRRINEAKSYEETTTAAAQSAAGAKLEGARGAADRRALSARAEADRFALLAAQAKLSRALTMRRLYIESVQALLDSTKRKIVVPDGGDIDLTVLGITDEAVRRTPTSAHAPLDAKPNH